MDSKIRLLNKFLSNSNYNNVCGYWIEEETNDVYLIINKELNKDSYSYVEVKKIRLKVTKDIKKWLNIKVFVGSISGDCDKIKD